MKSIRTPESRFENLPDYYFNPNYIDVETELRMHYLDEGNGENPTILLLHGEPSWSFLYRKMIPTLTENGFRVIAPDLIGFGKSDKPVEKSNYSYQSHIDWLTTFVTKLDLKEVILFCQDWGGLLGLRLITLMDRFSMVVASNTTLPTGTIPMPDSFLKWREFSQHSPDFNIGKVIDMGTIEPLTDDIINAYNAPFPTEEYKAGARIFPTLVPVNEDDPEAIKNQKAWEKLKQWNKPLLTVFGEQDSIMKEAEIAFQKLVPGAQNQDHIMLNAGHFIQEEKGEELAQIITEFYQKNK